MKLLPGVALLSLGLLASPAFASGEAISGSVSSSEEGRMEGVVVSAKGKGSTITVSVVTDAAGTFRFPASRIPAGDYAISVRAVGFELKSSISSTVPKAAPLAIHLSKVADVSTQMSDGEWIASFPGTAAEKALVQDCNVCHSLQRMVRSTHNSDEWLKVIERMSTYAYDSSGTVPQIRPVIPKFDAKAYRPLADYLAKVNLSTTPRWKYPLHTLPRLKGRSTRVVITEYDLPQPEMEPHDVVVDSKGQAWWADFMRPTLGTLDPKTGKTTLYQIPVTKPQFIVGNNDLEIDYREHLWTANMQQGSITDFDPVTRKFKTYTIDPNKYESVPMLAPPTQDDPHAWTNGEQLHGLHRLDTVTGKWEAVPLYEADGSALTAYGVYRDSDGNGYTLDFNDEGRSIAKVDKRTMKSQLFETPTAASRPRRGRPDGEGKLWFAEYGGNGIASFDFASKAFQEWPIPEPYFWPYDVVRDKNGEVWTGSMWNDHVARLDPKKGTFTLYPLPSSTNIRRVFVDNRTTPVTFWVGNNLHGSIIKVEPSN